MKSSINRRKFIKLSTMGGIGMSLNKYSNLSGKLSSVKKTNVGIIGLDTSHCIAFTKILNDPKAPPELAGYPVVAAYPYGSRTIESSYSRIPKYTQEIKKMGVDVVDSVDELLETVDVVLLETNDGLPHLEQAMKVFKAGKPVFIDKPVAASLTDVLAIFDAAKKYNVPMFSSSTLRYGKNTQAVRQGKGGKILGAETYGPAGWSEKTHTDFYLYGVHAVEALFTVMQTGCRSVRCVHTENADVVVGTWEEGRLGTFRGLKTGKEEFGGTAFGTEEINQVGQEEGYRPLLVQIVKFFRTRETPVAPQETKEIYAFMSAAAESKRRGGDSVTLKEVIVGAQQ